MPIVLEVCVDSLESALAAERGGADRIELCSALHVGGITPGEGLTEAVRTAVQIPIFVLVRPRAGDFVYSEDEFRAMRDDVLRAHDVGAHGVVVGLLHHDRSVDIERTRELVAVARPMSVTFNRAFDLSADLDRSLDDVMATGADRILTSGGEPSGVAGSAAIARLVRAAKGRITILGGGGIRAFNAREFVSSTGVAEVHSSLRSRAGSPGRAPEDVLLGASSGGPGTYVVTESKVAEFRRTLDGIGGDGDATVR